MQNKPNFPDAQILVNCVLTMDYVNIRLRSRFKNKANQTQFKPNQTQFKANQTQFKANSNPIFCSFYLTHAAYSPQSNPT
jgi:hypothetical protein